MSILPFMVLLAILGATMAFSQSSQQFSSLSTFHQHITCRHHCSGPCLSRVSSRRSGACFQRHRLLLDAVADDIASDDVNDDQMMDIDELTTNQLFELIELSFVQACVALSETGDVEPLKLFIVAVKTTAKRILSSRESDEESPLVELIASIPQSMKRLDKLESDLRDAWISAICKVLEYTHPEEFGNIIGGDISTKPTIGDAINTYSPVLNDLVAVHESGLGLNIENFVESRRDVLGIKMIDNVLALEESAEDDLRVAVVSQTIKVMYNTLIVLEDEQRVEDLAAEFEVEGGGNASKKSKKKGKKSSGGRGFG